MKLFNRKNFLIVVLTFFASLLVGGLCLAGLRGCLWKTLKTVMFLSLLVAASVCLFRLYRAVTAPEMNDGSTRLHRAALKEDIMVMRLMLNWIKVDAEDNAGETPLFVAANWGKEKAVKFLLDHCADVNARSNKGLTPLDACVANPSVWREKKKRVLDILLEHDAKASKELDALELFPKPPPPPPEVAIPALPAKTAEELADERKKQVKELATEYRKQVEELNAEDNARREKREQKLIADKNEALEIAKRAWGAYESEKADNRLAEEANFRLRTNLAKESDRAANLTRALQRMQEQLDSIEGDMTSDFLKHPQARLTDEQMGMTIRNAITAPGKNWRGQLDSTTLSRYLSRTKVKP